MSDSLLEPAVDRDDRRPIPAVLYAAGLLAVAYFGSNAAAAANDVTARTASGGHFAVATAPAAAGTASLVAAPSTDEVSLGYLPNITHAPALVGIHDGTFAAALGDEVELTTTAFNAGPDAVSALLSGAVDATFLGPNPAINGFAQSRGEGLRIVSGSTSGGAFLVVRPGIDEPADLAGTTIATPSLGNTQDVALRSWLSEQGLETTPHGGGDVNIVPQENGLTLDAIIAGDIDGAWLPEPWASRVLLETDADILVDERDLWPDGRYVTTHLVVNPTFLDQHPDIVAALIEGELAALTAIDADPVAAQTAVNDEIEAVTGKRLADEVIVAAWENLVFTYDPIASSLAGSAADAHAVGMLDDVDLAGIYDLTLLDEALAEHDLPPVSDSSTVAAGS
ncbi:MAG: ABC transporter substrate-binding protein [Desertimonas sp.]